MNIRSGAARSSWSRVKICCACGRRGSMKSSSIPARVSMLPHQKCRPARLPAASADARVNIIAEPAPQLLSEQEAPQARKLLEASRDTVINMFRDARLGKALSMTEASSLVQQVEMSITRNSGTLAEHDPHQDCR